MKILCAVLALSMCLATISPVYANEQAWEQFIINVKKEFPDQRPEIYVQSKDFVILLFGMENSMKEFVFHKQTGQVTTREIQKFEDSTKSLFHQEPYERLEKANEIYGSK
jgi:hypothetical protein